MIKKLVLIWIVILLAAGAVLRSDSHEMAYVISLASQKGSEENSYVPRQTSNSPVSCRYFNEPSFLDAVAAASIYQKDINGLKGGIVPHHLLASRMISSFWKTVSQADYDLIVIIGPDHNKRGCSDITTITSCFSTIYGDVAVDKNMADSLINGNFAAEDQSVMEDEYSVSTHMPFIKYYMPDTPVLPLLVYGNCSMEKLSALSKAVSDASGGKKILIVASIDFSHYLPFEKANEMDIVTEEAIMGFDYDKILQMNNDNLDSRPSALFLLLSMAESDAGSIEKWAHSNSDVISITATGNTTSYFTFGFFNMPLRDKVNNEIIPSAAELNITAVGDIMLGRGVAERLKARGSDYRYPFMETADILKEGDIVFGNLEQPITDKTECLDNEFKYVLKSETEAVQGIGYAGFNLLSLAKNHIMDYYRDGLLDTMNILDENGIAYAGAGKNREEARRPAIIECNGMKIGLLAYTDMAEIYYEGNPSIRFAADEQTPGVASRNPEWIMEDIRELRDQVDLIIISLHWGTEDSYIVSDDQINFAHRLIDQGADMILGHHPHRFQGIEIYHGKPIAYSLGNFIFDQNDPQNQESFILNLTYSGSSLVELSVIPTAIIDKTQVVLQEGPHTAAMLEREKRLSYDLDTGCSIINGRLVYDID